MVYRTDRFQIIGKKQNLKHKNNKPFKNNTRNINFKYKTSSIGILHDLMTK